MYIKNMCVVLFCGVAFVSLSSVTNIPSACSTSCLPSVLRTGKRISGLTVPADTNSIMIAGAEKFNSLSTNTWSKGNTSFSVAVCVGIKFGGGLPRQVVFRDFSYDEDGQLMRVSAEYTDKQVRDAAEQNENNIKPAPAVITPAPDANPGSGTSTNLPAQAAGPTFSKTEAAWTQCKQCGSKIKYERTYKWSAREKKWTETTASLPSICRACKKKHEQAATTAHDKEHQEAPKRILDLHDETVREKEAGKTADVKSN